MWRQEMRWNRVGVANQFETLENTEQNTMQEETT